MRSAFPFPMNRALARTEPATERARLRADIQGLRAVAVIVVVLDHLVGWPSGGFIGVDIFFVISGFLITGLLLREYERTRAISFADFYRRRIKRILPASTLAIAVTLVGAFLVFGTARFVETLKDGAAAALFSANWRFSATGTDYFLANGPVSPLQHFWSLSVEEQFYFGWPAVMLLSLTMMARRGGGRHALLGGGVVIGLVSLASLAWAVWETQALPTRAYFSTFSRIWELGAGAALAFAAPLCGRLPDRVRPVIAWLGIATMVAGMFLIDSSSAFPAPWALLPVTGTVLVILAGTGADQHRLLFPLTNPVSGYLGNISYSLYLWHFPVIIFAGVIFAERSPLFYLACVTTMVLAAVYSFHLVEEPVRRSSWLSGGRATTPGTAPARGAGFRRAAVAASITALVTAVALPFVPAQEKDIRLGNALPVGVSNETADLQERIRTALGSTEWPDLNPTMDEAMAGLQAPEDITSCGGTGQIVVEDCTWGDPDATRHVVVVGDSIAMTWVSPLREALGSDRGWDVTSLGTFGCTFTDLLIENPEPEVVQACEDRKSQAVRAINELEPDVVVIANTYEPRFPESWNEPMTPQEWQGSMKAIIDRFSDSVGRVVFLAPPPLYTDVTSCYSKMAQPSYCAGTIDPQWRTFAGAEQELADSVGGTFVDPELWFCAEGWCPSFVGTTPTKRDLVHMTPAYQMAIAPALRAELIDQGIVDF